MNESKIIQTKSSIGYNYATVKITQSRLDKGLIAIPKSLSGWFPKQNTTIKVYFDDSQILQLKPYSSYESSTRECRIGGMRDWFREKDIQNGDEVVIQVLDERNFVYRLIIEKEFIVKAVELQRSFDDSENEDEAKEKVDCISIWTDYNIEEVIMNEFFRLVSDIKIEDRRYIDRDSIKAREAAPSNLRVLLGEIYNGHCQVCDFWFLKKDEKPYFEIHHINPQRGNHPKNLVLVCANCHRQFEFAKTHQFFNDDDWLVKVSFNETIHTVNQIILKTEITEFYKQLHI